MDREFYIEFLKVIRFTMKYIYHVNINGAENIDPEKNYLFLGNHLNILDSWVLAYVVDDIIRFMVDKKLYRYKSWENFFTKMGTFPIDPQASSDMHAVKTAIQLLKENEKVCIFPEGATHSRKIDLPFKPGTPKIAALSNTEVIPFGINGSYIPFTDIDINFGEPINFKELDIPRTEWDTYLEQKIRSLQAKSIR